MGTTRYFGGNREGSGRSAASELIRFEMQKKGKLSPAERYKRIMKKKLLENQNAAALANKKANNFKLPGSIQEARQMSKQAEKAMKELAAKKAAKQAKADRRMVIVQPRNFSNGRLTKKGQIYDIAGNIIGAVNTKNGKIATSSGWAIGKYKPKSQMTNMLIQESITKFSPYYINLRKMQMMQNGGGDGVWGPANDTVNVQPVHRGNHGVASMFGYTPGAPVFDSYGADVSGPRQNVGVTAWGAASDNVWGTFADNVLGMSTDNIWGGNSSDVWGGMGGNPFGNFAKTVRIWGSGNGKNYFKGAVNHLAAIFGIRLKSAQSASIHETLLRRSRSTRSSGSAGVTRSSGPSTRSSAPAAAPRGRTR